MEKGKKEEVDDKKEQEIIRDDNDMEDVGDWQMKDMIRTNKEREENVIKVKEDEVNNNNKNFEMDNIGLIEDKEGNVKGSDENDEQENKYKSQKRWK